MSFSPRLCPNPDCSHHKFAGARFSKKGFFLIRRLNQKVRRFQCSTCKKIFSSRTFKADYRHKKMDLNFKLAKLLVEGNSLRSCSRILNLSYSNTYNKFLWLKNIVELNKSKLKFKASEIQFDELETIHHTKCKPLSIALVVTENYELLSAQVAEMPSKGRIATFSRLRYGPRKDERTEKIKTAFLEAKLRLQEPPQIIRSDKKPGYEKIVKEEFLDVPYEQHNRAEKERLQSRLHEMKNKKRFDPLFAVNQKCALLRSHIKRLTRRSWCTTKKVENLQLHLDLFVVMQVLEKF